MTDPDAILDALRHAKDEAQLRSTGEAHAAEIKRMATGPDAVRAIHIRNLYAYRLAIFRGLI